MSDFVNSNVRQGSYGPNWVLSMENADLIRKGYYPKVFKQFGRIYGMHDLLMGMGNEISIPAQNQKVVEEYAPYWPIKIESAIAAGAAGEDITIVVDSSSLISNVHQVRVGFTIMIPADYMPTGYTKDAPYKVTALSQTNVANDTLTCSPALAGSTYTKSQISTEVPAGTYLMIGYSQFARGTGQPEGTYDYPITREYTSHIIKETKGFDGGTLSQESVIPDYNGVNWLWSRESMDAEFRLKDQLEMALLFSEPNDNSTLVSTDTMSGQSASDRSTRGLISWLDDSGQKLYYTDSPTLSLLDDIRKSLTTQGVYTSTVTLFCAPEFHVEMQKEAKDHIRDYSGGSDFLNAAKDVLGINILTIVWGGITFYLHPLATLAKPGQAGLTISDSKVYAAGSMAIAVPDCKVTVNKWGQEGKMTIPNLWLGYVNYNGEDRKRVAKRYLGMNGVWPTMDIADDKDGYKLFWMSEFMLGGAEWNKMILIRKQKT